MWATGTRVRSLRPLKNKYAGKEMPAGTQGTVEVRPVPDNVAEAAALLRTSAFWVKPDGYPPGWAWSMDWEEVPKDRGIGSWDEIAKKTGWNPCKEAFPHGR